MNIPNGATHYCKHNGLYYKQINECVYVWSSVIGWMQSIGGSLDGHEFIKPIVVESSNG